MIIGFSNGAYYRLHSSNGDRLSERWLGHFNEGDVRSIQLTCFEESMLDDLFEFDPQRLNDFSHIVLHAPTHPFSDDDDSMRLLEKISAITKRLALQNVVIHPDPVRSWSVFERFPDIPFSIENMDNEKPCGRNVEDIAVILDKYAFSLTLDLQHCFTNDPTMRLAEDFHIRFGDRIAQYHVSGYDPRLLHVPLFATKQDAILNSIHKGIPIIIESVFDTEGDHTKEIEYIRAKIEKY